MARQGTGLARQCTGLARQGTGPARQGTGLATNFKAALDLAKDQELLLMEATSQEGTLVLEACLRQAR